MNERRLFHFLCPPGVEYRAVEILIGLGDCVSDIGIGLIPETRVTFDPETGQPTISDASMGIMGQALPEYVEQIIRALAAERIAGYSRETMIFFPELPADENFPGQAI